MASLELGKLSSYDLLLSETSNDIYYMKLTDSLYKTLEDYHQNKNKGQIQLSVNKLGKGGAIKVIKEGSTSNYSFKCNNISNKTGLDCLKQSSSNPGLTVIGTAHTRLIIQATDDVYQVTRKKLIQAEEKKNENKAVMIDFKNKRKMSKKLHEPMTSMMPNKSAHTPVSAVAKAAQRSMPTFKVSPSVADSKSAPKLREKAIHILALRPHRKPELLAKLSDGTNKKDAITKILAQVSNTQNNMFHLKSFLYGEVQVDTWPDYSDSDRAAIRQQMALNGYGSTQPEAPELQTKPPMPPPQQQHPPPLRKPERSEVVRSDKPDTHKGSEAKPSEKARKRSSADDNKVTKKVCREKENERVVDEKGVNINVKCRKAAEDLGLPFMENVKKEIYRIQSEYTKIVTEEQKISYAAEFQKDYDEYVKLKRREKQIGSQFDKLRASYDKADKRSSEVRGINRKTRDLFKQYINDNSWCNDKEKLLNLEAKLSHIKHLFKVHERDSK